ncbi:eppin-like [Crassostrea angulata]|uniref:eppin-like n=1 Tax=Magallana angulata TaxID=2784310 RepID=UPI0022B217F6|nr:eppin-like [Crassostrea angulata]
MDLKLIIMCLFVSTYAQQYDTEEKPGRCPSPYLRRLCFCVSRHPECYSDYDCPERQKCCDQGCGCPQRCVNPVRRPDRQGKHITCYQPKEVGLCRAAIRRWWYNRRTKQCETFIYGGCGGNGNNYKTKRQCEQRCKRANSYLPGRR